MRLSKTETIAKSIVKLLANYDYIKCIIYAIVKALNSSRGISSVVERLLSMHEVVGSIPTFSTFCIAPHETMVAVSTCIFFATPIV